MKFLEPYADLLNAPDEQSWIDAFFSHTRRLGFDYCLYGTIQSHRAALSTAWVRSSFPQEWLERYFGKGYVAFDYKVIHCMNNSVPLFWSPEVFASPEQRRVYDEGCVFGLRAGVSFPAHGAGGTFGQMCLSKDMDPGEEFQRHVESCLMDLLILRDIVAHTSRAFAFPNERNKVRLLTVREQECLRWAATGKSSKQIAELLFCAEPTVNFHLANARKKLGVPTRQAAVAAAIQCGELLL
jgi:LuxR family quorum-sensing transcriptional regulator LasR